MFFMRKTTALPSASEALPGRATAIPTANAIACFDDGGAIAAPLEVVGGSEPRKAAADDQH